MGRFLMFISYIGTRYRGIQLCRKDRTVAGALNELLKVRFKDTDFEVKVLSRTDAGVHAIHSPLVLRIFNKNVSDNLEPKALTFYLNFWLNKMGEEILVHKVQRICTFSSSNPVIRRTYLYRLGVLQSLPVNDPTRGKPTFDYIAATGSVFQSERCHLVSPPFDMDKFLEAAGFLCGENNFYHFTTTSGLKTFGNKLEKNMEIEIKRGQSLFTDFHPELTGNLEFWEVHFKSNGFIYRQVRRMMGYMIRYAKHKLDSQMARDLLGGDQKFCKPASHIPTISPNGLFLKNVEFNQDAIACKKYVEDHPYTILRGNLSYLRWLLRQNQRRRSNVTLSEVLKKNDQNKYSNSNLKDFKFKKHISDVHMISTEKWMRAAEVIDTNSGVVVVSKDKAFCTEGDVSEYCNEQADAEMDRIYHDNTKYSKTTNNILKHGDKTDEETLKSV